MEPQSTALTTWLRSPYVFLIITRPWRIDPEDYKKKERSLLIASLNAEGKQHLNKMRFLSVITCVGVVGLAALGVAMAKTNPTKADYEDYAVQRLTEYLDQNVCTKTTSLLENLIKFDCQKFLNSANPQIREIIAGSTHRENFIVFSIYRTEFKLNSWLPSYKLETVGAFDSFYTYNSQKQ